MANVQTGSGVDFKSLLGKNVDTVEKPKPKPGGTYHGVIEGFKFDLSQKQKTPFVRVTAYNVSPGQDIDPNDLAENKIDLTKWKPHRDFYLTEDALYRLREFLESLGITTTGRSFNETLPEIKGKPVIMTAVNGTTTNEATGETSIFTNIADMRGA